MKVMQEYIPIQYEVGKQLTTSLPALFLLILEVHYLLSAVQLLKYNYLTLVTFHIGTNATVHSNHLSSFITEISITLVKYIFINIHDTSSNYQTIV